MALKGIKVIEMLGLAPGPFCGSILADFGATVTVIQKIQPTLMNIMLNGKRTISIDLKSEEGANIVKKMSDSADVLLDTFRPGVMENLGLGPDTLMKANKRLIYARLTGYGQTGVYKEKAGHDINYVAMSGALSLLRCKDQFLRPPMNLLADFAGGSLPCFIGIILALLERTRSGAGQIIDASMTEGAAYLASWIFQSKMLPIWTGECSNILDGTYPFYCTYKTKDDKYIAVGAIEPQFYEKFLKGLNVTTEKYPQFEKSNRNKFQEIFLTKTQNEWCIVFKDLDACVTPVLELNELANHDLTKSRKSFFMNEHNIPVPTPAPRLSRTPGISMAQQPAPHHGENTIEILKELQYSDKHIQGLLAKGCIYAKKKSNL